MEDNVMRYAYYYARINANNLCVEVKDTTNDYSGDPMYIRIDVYDVNYMFKYYNPADGLFYYDAAYTKVFVPKAQ